MLTISTSSRDSTLLNTGLERTTSHIHFGRFTNRRDVEVEDVHGQAESSACIWNVDDSGYMTLDGGRGQYQIRLVVGIAEAAEIFDAA